MQYITNDKAIMIFLNGRNVRVEKTDNKYPKIINVFKLPLEEQDRAMGSILNESVKAKDVIGKSEGFEIVYNDDSEDSGGEIFYKGEKLPKAFATKVFSIIRDELPLDHFVKFWENLSENPSSESVKELVNFLEYKELPISEDGYIIAYKGVNGDYYSVHGNIYTKVLQGTVDTAGRIYNAIGEVVEVRRRDVCDNREFGCSAGLHIGSFTYATNWGSKTMVVKVNPKDVVSVPNDCECQKCRVCKYEVVGEYEREITASVVDSDGNDNIVPDITKERREFIGKVEGYLSNKYDNGVEEVTLRQIQNSFSPYWPSKEEILDALQELGRFWTTKNGIITIEC